jgi:hypothetical protein
LPALGRASLATHAALVMALDARLLSEHNMPLGSLEALIQIAHAEHGSLSVSELAELHVVTASARLRRDG